MNRRITVFNIQQPIFHIQAGTALLLALLAFPARAEDRQVRELTLAECVGLALEHNLDLKIQKLAREEARLEVGAAQGGYDPAVKVAARRAYDKTAGQSAGTAAGALEVLDSETDSDTLDAAVGGGTPLGGLSYEVGAQTGRSDGTREGNPFDTSTGSAGLTLTQPLLKGFKTDGTRYQVQIAQKQSAEAAAQLEAQMQDVLTQVETAWYGLIQAREEIRVQEEAVRLATQLYEDNRRKVQIGAMSILDEKQAESQAAAARAGLSTAKQAYAEAENRLKALLFANHREWRKVAVSARGELVAEPVPADAAASGARALEQRPDLRQARLALERLGLTVTYRRNQTLPELDLVGGYGVAASDEDSRADVFDQLQAAGEPYWNAGVVLSFPLGNRTERNRHRQSLAAQEKSKLELRKLEESALVEVDNAAAAVATGLERVQSTREARAYAEQALAAEEKKLERGKSTSFVVLQLQRDVTSARRAEIAARADYNQQCAALALAEGAMLERHGIEFADPADAR